MPRWLGGLLLALLVVLVLLAACDPWQPELAFAPERMPDAQAGQAYTVTVSVSGNVTPVGDIFVQDGALPPGLQLHAVRGKSAADISGTPEQAGSYEFTVGAWCLGTNVSGQTGKRKYVIVVK